jgi:hypothetical protein
MSILCELYIRFIFAYLFADLNGEMTLKEHSLTASLRWSEEEFLAMSERQLERLCPDEVCRGNWERRVLFYGASQILRLAQRVMYRRLNTSGQDLWILDGANAFDPFLISRQAQEMKALPEEYLRRVRISRSFTAHQMLSLLRHATKDEAESRNRDYLLLGPLTSFYDENVPLYEARALFQVFRQELDRLPGGKGILWLVCQQPALTHRRRFVGQLTEMADQVFCGQESDRRLIVYQEKPRAKQAKEVLCGTKSCSSPLLDHPHCDLLPGT